MKRFIKHIVYKTLFRPPYIRYCSQTVYESLLGCMRMWEATHDDMWKDRADHVLDILLRIQRPDGGFDIGYDFNFGLLHKSGQSTSPELVGLVALAEYGRLFGNDKIIDGARRAADWIRRNAIDMGDGKYAIPYSPYTCREVMVYNGVSFAAGALGCYLGYIEDDRELRKIYNGMIAYMNSVISSDKEIPGRYWHYSDQSRDGLTEMQRNKIDYYHQMQQVEMHSLAQQASNNDEQLEIIADAADLIVALAERYEVLPYTNSDMYFEGRIHLWGLASTASGLLEAAVVVPQQKDVFHDTARWTMNWILKHGWNGEYFAAVLDGNGDVVSGDYMVRSDAWVFNTLAACRKHLGDGPWSDVAEKCFVKMDSVDFSGPESHASTRIQRFAYAVSKRIKRVFIRQEDSRQ